MASITACACLLAASLGLMMSKTIFLQSRQRLSMEPGLEAEAGPGVRRLVVLTLLTHL